MTTRAKFPGRVKARRQTALARLVARQDQPPHVLRDIAALRSKLA